MFGVGFEPRETSTSEHFKKMIIWFLAKNCVVWCVKIQCRSWGSINGI